MDYVNEFNQMVSKLKADSQVSLVSSYIRPPLTDLEISSAEQTLNCKLDSSLQEFYRQCNGFQLRWIFKDSEDYNPGEFGSYSPAEVSFQDILDDDSRLDGCINILPLSDAISQTYYPLKPHLAFTESITMHGRIYSPEEFMRNAMVWDAFEKHRCVILFPVRDKEIQLCILNTDGIVQHSKKTNAEEYLNFLFHTNGSIMDRVNAFKFRRSLFDSPDSIDVLT